MLQYVGNWAVPSCCYDVIQCWDLNHNGVTTQNHVTVTLYRTYAMISIHEWELNVNE